MIRVTNLPGADLNAAGSGLAEARPMDGPSNESSQRICNLKDGGHKFHRPVYHHRATFPLFADVCRLFWL
ncbi:hypothetical protein GCT62_17610 [Yersinia enterocolitica]|nr:hypothetical protein [Yersinia enterocolitica]